MLKYYKVEFYRGLPDIGPFAHILARDSEEAAILAKAERILSGRTDYAIEHVWEVMDAKVLAKVQPLASTGFPRIFDFNSL